MSVIYVLSYFSDGQLRNLFPNDLIFHLNRIVAMNSVIHGPVNFDAFSNVGHPVNFFYPWQTFFPAYILSRIFKSVVSGYIAFIALLTFSTFYISKYCYAHVFHEPFGAFLFSIFYTLSAYRSVDIFARNAVGEFIAFTFVPIAFAGMYKIIFTDQKSPYVLALGMSLIIYSHVLTSILTVFFLVIMLVVGLCSKKVVSISKTFKSITLSIVLVIISTSFFWFQMFSQVLTLKSQSPYDGFLSRSALAPSDLIIGSINNDYSVFTIGLITLFLLVVSIVQYEKIPTVIRATLFMGILASLMTTKIFPWPWFQSSSIVLLQFPTRISTFATLFISISGSYVLSHNFRKKISMGIVLLTIIFSVFGATNLINLDNERQVLTINKHNETEYSRYSDNTDYYPKNSDKNTNKILRHDFYLNHKSVAINYCVKDNRAQFTLPAGDLTEKLNIDTPFIFSYGITAQQGSKPLHVKKSNAGTVQIVDVKGQKPIVITSSYTPIVKVLIVLSLLTTVFILLKSMKLDKLRFKNNIFQKR